MTLSAYLSRRKLTQAHFATLCDLSETHVGRLITGEKFPSFDSMIKIHNVTGGKVSFRDLAGPRLDNYKQAC